MDHLADSALLLQELSFSSGNKVKYLFAQKSLWGSDAPSELERAQILEQAASLIQQDFVRKEFPSGLPRYEEFFLSRYLLTELVKDFRKRHVGGVAVSLSHTDGAAIVAGAGTLKAEGVFFASGVGVDLEREDRKISEAVFKRLLKSPIDKTIEALLLWAIKEASFKAHTHNDALLLSDFEVQQLIGDEARLECLKTRQSFEAKWIRKAGFLLVFARGL